MKYLRKAADQNYPAAQYYLGTLYRTDWVDSPNEAEAARLVRLAAEQGFALAQYNLGILSEREEDYTDAVKWYRKAAEQGEAVAQINLGLM